MPNNTSLKSFQIAGLQKLTLLDYPGRTACTVFAPGCPFRCGYCHNYDLACSNDAPYTLECIKGFLISRRKVLEGVAITGGEPCMQGDALIHFVEQIKELGFLVKVDTNGAYPEVVKELIPLVDYFAMDIKASPDTYAKACGLDKSPIDRIEETISILMSKAKNYEFRTTIARGIHNESEVNAIGQLVKGAKQLYLQPFVLSEGVRDKSLSTPPLCELRQYKAILERYIEKVRMRGTTMMEVF